MKELAAHETRLIDWRWMRVAHRRFASSRSYWLMVPGWCFRATWVRTNSRRWIEWSAAEREYPFRRTLKLGRRRSLFLTIERTRVSRETQMFDWLLCLFRGHVWHFWYRDDLTGLQCWATSDDCQRCGSRRKAAPSENP